ncbi:MAG: Sensor kinase [Thermoleophilia bacterium]|nr:Sensor kinase [Thermoleophilia bacterium]
MSGLRPISLFWRVFVLDAALFMLVALLLLFPPVTISAPIAPHEAVTVVISLCLVLAINALVLWRAIQPLQRLADRMEVVDLLRPGQRLQVEHGDEIGRVVRSFNQMLDRLEGERQQSGRRMLQAQEAERIAISRDLHDEVGQLLTAVLLELDAATETGTAMDLAPAVASARRALDEVRRISQALRPQMLEELGLVSALSELCSTFERTTGAVVERDFARDLPTVDGDVELALYRIAQESLTNVARHADARHVRVSLAMPGHDIVLRITDDGVGIEPDDEQAGGLRSMRERALLIGATLAIQSTGSGGTEVRLELPIERLDAVESP